jgi:hypothetical protein
MSACAAVRQFAQPEREAGRDLERAQPCRSAVVIRDRMRHFTRTCCDHGLPTVVVRCCGRLRTRRSAECPT